MSADQHTGRRLGIALRTALLSWLVTSVTLLIFVAVVLPQQRRTLLENLRSKAYGTMVSVRDVGAGALINTDYTSVVDHCNEILSEDRSVDYLVITKSGDGASLIHERDEANARDGVHWLETSLPSEWRPSERTPTGAIRIVPPFHRRVFLYSHPFDYQGVEWGWIHVGLSLESYDRSMTTIYRRTAVLAIVCLGLSLLASIVYAKRIVRPILRLHEVVQQVASGDMSARAELGRRDELGILASSVNTMTEALLRRDWILEGVRFAAQEFLSASDWREVIQVVLGKLGQAAGASRAYLGEIREAGATVPQASQYHEWTAPQAPQSTARLGGGSIREVCTPEAPWCERLRKGDILSGPVSRLPDAERAPLEARAARSCVIIPIHVENRCWGFLGLDDCLSERIWTEAEMDSLRAVAGMLGATIARQGAQEALVEAKAQLEARVQERTQELLHQVHAKEQALLERRQAEATLLESEERFRGLFENATLGIYRTSGDRRILLANAALLKMMRFPSIEAARTFDLERDGYVRPEERDGFRSVIARDGQVMGLESQWHRYDGTVIHVRESAKEVRDTQGDIRWYEGTVEDISDQKAAEAELTKLNHELQEAAHQAGMAEVATGVLHNVGNVLNSVNVSCSLVLDRIRQSEVAQLSQLASLLESQGDRLTEFLARDPRGQNIPAYIRTLAGVLTEEQQLVLRELKGLEEQVDHIKQIVAMQQDYASVSGLEDTFPVTQLVEDALRLNAGTLSRHGVRVERHFEGVPPITTNRHKVLQILLNLVRNGEFACTEGGREPKVLTLRVHAPEPGKVAVQVSDNGIGFPEENRLRIFSHGFTTKRNGHGFGLHSGALAARELGGSLAAHSAGPGQGATFVLSLPIRPPTHPTPL
jgi:PAS domain S-box-containing protein